MTRLPEPDEFRSVDWENLPEKRDWSATAWTVTAVLIILLSFFGGMVLRTSLTGGPGVTEEQVIDAQDARISQNADQHPRP